MPKIAYGVLDMHVTHRIERPDPARAQSFDRPDACTLCHVERTRSWAAEQRARLWNTATSPVAERPAAGLPLADDAALGLSELERMALAGDPVQRVAALHALGEKDRARGRRLAFQAALLTDVMEHDRYPAVRRFARNALASLVPDKAEVIARFVPEATPDERAVEVAALRESLSIAPLPIDSVNLQRLREQANEVAIEIGE
jgi:hypothetical protein